MAKIQISLAITATAFLVFPLSQVPRLIAADIHDRRGKRLKNVRPHAFHQRPRLRIGRIEGQPAHPLWPRHAFPVGGRLNFGEMTITWHRQNSPHVSQISQCRNQHDKAVSTILIKFAHFIRGQSFIRTTNLRIERKDKGMFNVELQLVDLECRQPIHQHLHRVEGGDFPTRHIKKQTARGEVRPVLDRTTGNLARKVIRELRYRLQSVKTGSRSAPGQSNSRGVDLNPVAVTPQIQG